MSDILLQNRMTTLEEMMLRLTRNAEQSDKRLERLTEKVEQTTENLDRLGQELRASHEQMRAERKTEKKEWNKQWGQLSNKWGRMVEDLVAPSLPRLLREVAPCPPDDEPMVQIRALRRHPKQKGRRFEMDGVVDCGEYALFCECKSTLKSADITKLVSKLAQARDYFPEYAHHHLLGAVAALHIEPSLVQYASEQGIFAFAVGEELMDVQNEASFTPRHF